MSFRHFSILCFVISSLWGSSIVFAQVDASAQVLLRPSETPKPNATGLQSGRYKIKKEKPSDKTHEKKVSQLPAKKFQQLDFRNPEVDQATTVVLPPMTTSTTIKAVAEKKSTKPSVLNQMLFSQPVVASQPLPVSSVKANLPVPVSSVVDAEPDSGDSTETLSPAGVSPNSGSANPIAAPVTEQPAVTDQVKDLVMGKDLPAVEAYKEQIHPDDVRLNRIEINVLPGVVANASKSSYSFRNYNAFSPKVLIGAEFWVTPFLGLYGNYTTSMGADIVGNPTDDSRIPVQHEWSEVGLDLRRFFGMSRKSNSLKYGIHISEYKFIVPGDDLHRVTLKSSGIGLHLSARVPVAPTYAWIFGGKFMPRVQHSEVATGISLSSGSPAESSRVDFSLGGEFKLQRQNQILWDLTVSLEKNHFAGSATLADPETGAIPKGVSVENTFTMFSLGYRWGQ